MNSLKLHYMHRYVKTLLQVMFGKYTAGTRVGSSDKHSMKQSQYCIYMTKDSTPSTLFWYIMIKSCLTDLLLCVGRTINNISGKLKTSFVSIS